MTKMRIDESKGVPESPPPPVFSLLSLHSSPIFSPQECIISGLLSVMGLKVLHIDRNAYYGGDCASLNLTNLYAKFRPEGSREPSAALGSNRDYNVDLVPKFIMACGNLVKILLHTKVRKGGRQGGKKKGMVEKKDEYLRTLFYAPTPTRDLSAHTPKSTHTHP